MLDSTLNLCACAGGGGQVDGDLCEICGSQRDHHTLHDMADGRSFLLPCEADMIPADGADPECVCGFRLCVAQQQSPRDAAGPLDAADDAQIAAGMNASLHHGGGKSPLLSVFSLSVL